MQQPTSSDVLCLIIRYLVLLALIRYRPDQPPTSPRGHRASIMLRLKEFLITNFIRWACFRFCEVIMFVKPMPYASFEVEQIVHSVKPQSYIKHTKINRRMQLTTDMYCNTSRLKREIKIENLYTLNFYICFPEKMAVL